jgi:hypothetical protein
MANGFNPLANLAQGLNIRQGMQQQEQQNQLNQLRATIGQQASQGGFNPAQSLEFQQLAALDPTGASRSLATFNALDQTRKVAMFQDAREAKRMLESGNEEGFLNLIGSRIQAVNQLGGDPSDVLFIANQYEQGNIEGVMQSLSNMEKIGILRGYLKAPEQQPLIDKDFLKEERKVARDAVTNFNKRAGEIRSSFGKVDTILNSGKLNRMKIASAMTSMARLLSPGIVTESDFRNLSNSTNPIATVINTLRGKGAEGESVVDELQKYVDPTNPDLFDREAFLQTASNVAAAEAPSLIDTLKDAEQRGITAGLSQRAMDANFKNNKNLKALQGMIDANKPVMKHPVLGNVTEDQIQKTMKNKNMTREQVLAILNQG